MATRVTIKTPEDARRYLASTGALDTLEIDARGRVREDKVCSRCGGSGSYSWCAQWGTACFGCTARGGSPMWTQWTPLVAYAKAARKRELADARKARKAEERRLQREQWARDREARKLDGQRRWCEANGFGPITFAEKDELQRAEAAKRQHVGSIGQRAEFDVTLATIASYERRSFAPGSDYETAYVHIFRDPAGNKLVWTTGSRLDAEEGAKLRIRATPRKHDSYRGEPQTVVNRVAVQSQENEAAA